MKGNRVGFVERGIKCLQPWDVCDHVALYRETKLYFLKYCHLDVTGGTQVTGSRVCQRFPISNSPGHRQDEY